MLVLVLPALRENTALVAEEAKDKGVVRLSSPENQVSMVTTRLSRVAGFPVVDHRLELSSAAIIVIGRALQFALLGIRDWLTRGKSSMTRYEFTAGVARYLFGSISNELITTATVTYGARNLATPHWDDFSRTRDFARASGLHWRQNAAGGNSAIFHHNQTYLGKSSLVAKIMVEECGWWWKLTTLTVLVDQAPRWNTSFAVNFTVADCSGSFALDSQQSHKALAEGELAFIRQKQWYQWGAFILYSFPLFEQTEVVLGTEWYCTFDDFASTVNFTGWGRWITVRYLRLGRAIRFPHLGDGWLEHLGSNSAKSLNWDIWRVKQNDPVDAWQFV